MTKRISFRHKKIALILLAIVVAIVVLFAVMHRSQQQMPEMLSEVPSQFAELDGTRIHYKMVGEGSRTLVFVHGFGCDMNTWAYQYEAFKDDTTLSMIFVDLPGYGQSDKPQVDYTLDFFASALKAVVDKALEGRNRVVLVGHSLGTPVCRRFVQNYPDMAAGLCDVDGVYCLYPQDSQALAAYEEAVQGFASSFCGEDVKENISQFVGSLAGPYTPPDITEYAMSVMPETPGYVACSTMSNLIDHRYWDGSVIEVPTFVICTQNSGLEPDNKEQMAALYANLYYVELSTCGHFIHWEELDLFNEKLSWWLETVVTE